jgi:hypothetical protein
MNPSLPIRRFSTSLLVSALLVAAAPSVAADPVVPPSDPGKQPGGGRMQACRADAQRLCANVEQGGGRKLICLESHKADLAPDCRDALAKVETMRKSGATPK